MTFDIRQLGNYHPKMFLIETLLNWGLEEKNLPGKNLLNFSEMKLFSHSIDLKGQKETRRI